MSVVACHELLHALGNLHEQSRSDARSFVILRHQTRQSRIRNGTENFGFDYDFGSVLHYGGRYDAENDQYSLITLPRFYQQTIGQRERISFKDAALINQIYCKDSCKGHEDKCQNGGYLNPNDCTKCHCPDGYDGDYCKELEENVNCNMLADESRELKSDQTVKVLNPMIGCTSAGKECRAKLCCPRALTDLNGNEYKNWIEAEKPDMDIVISAHLSPNWTVPSTVFELTKCPHAENVYAEKRNPGTGTLRCYNPTKKQYYDCSCHGDKKCLAEEKWAHDRFLCPIMQVNGIQLQKDPRYNWTRLDIDCYKAEAGTVSFWGYSKPDTKEIIRVDEIHCLTDGVLKRFKSLQVDEQPPMKLSPTSPFLANNDASSLIHVPLSSDVGIWKTCNGKNGTILVENGCTKLLICYQSEMAKNKKIGKRFGVGKGNIGKQKFVEYAEPLGNELQEALSSAAFFDDFMPFVLAFEFGAKFCTEKAGTTKLCKEKCLTKAPFVGTTKSHGKTKTATTTTSIPTTTEEQTFSFWPFSEFVSHFGTNCSKIVFPVEVAKFIVNITARPYRIACNDYEKEYEIGQLPNNYVANAYKGFFNACMAVPTTKCAKHAELNACYKSMKTVVPSNNAIAKLCQDHLNETNVAGFAVQICIHRDEKEQKLVFETFLNLSTTDEFIKMTRSYQISIEEIIETKKTIPIFFLEFGTDHQQSAIREKANGEVISEASLTENAIGIGTVLNDIKAEKINENLAKMIHLVPPVADQMVAFFQIPTPEFSKLISAQTNLKPYENDPKKVGRSSRCDTYGKDCAVIMKLLHKINELRNCKNETNDTSGFRLPPGVDIPPPALPYITPTKTLTCFGEMYCSKEILQQQYDLERERCGLKPENLISRRRKRQFRPLNGTQLGKWNSFPIVLKI
ncbi:hypothetical protein niasHT_002142 [Heterodera trifolii]|uniref:Peptidase M12A domain-containing protein n=1 Tax=Heterodera trifolii TaxID=157864 RepID=A0ABD2LY95_9BILA